MKLLLDQCNLLAGYACLKHSFIYTALVWYLCVCVLVSLADVNVRKLNLTSPASNNNKVLRINPFRPRNNKQQENEQTQVFTAVWMNRSNIDWVTEARHKIIHIVWFYLFINKTKLLCLGMRVSMANGGEKQELEYQKIMAVSLFRDERQRHSWEGAHGGF